MTAGTEDRDKVAELIESELNEVRIPDVGIGMRDHPLVRVAAAQGVTFNAGRIVLAGRTSSGTWVQFNADTNTGWASAWPEWAFEIAKDALINDKKVWVIANDEPFGSNLTNVILSAS
jgi:hypothetical protein